VPGPLEHIRQDISSERQVTIANPALAVKGRQQVGLASAATTDLFRDPNRLRLRDGGGRYSRAETHKSEIHISHVHIQDWSPCTSGVFGLRFALPLSERET
jgi:hypothetical protein